MISIIFLTLLFTYVSCDCPSGWLQFKDSCYWASSSKAYSWSSAQAQCKSKHAFLTEIGDHDENDFIARMTFGAGDWFFMGIEHEESCGGWVKARNHRPIDYTNWLEDESNKIDKPNCVIMGYLGYWESFSCDEEQYFICESDNYIRTSAFGGWIPNTNSFTYGGHYYRTVGKKATFANAKAMCEKAGGYLVEPDDEGENAYVHDKMHEAFFGFWRYIGGNDRKREGYFVWGKKQKPLTFKNWWPGEPNNKHGEDCMEMRYWGKWNDVDCYSSNRYICEKPADAQTTTAEAGETTTEQPEPTTEYYYDYYY